MENEQQSYTLVELSKRANTTTDVLRAYINAGKLQGTKVTRGYRIAADEAERFLEMLQSDDKLEFSDIGVPKMIEYSSVDGMVDRIMGISTGEIFSFMMRSLDAIKDFNAGGPRDEPVKVTPQDVKLLTHIIKEGHINVIPREQRIEIQDSDPVTSLLVRSMATGIACTFEELSKQQSFAVETDKIKAATDHIIKVLD